MFWLEDYKVNFYMRCLVVTPPLVKETAFKCIQKMYILSLTVSLYLIKIFIR